MTGRIFRRHFLTLLPQTLVSLCFIAVIGSTGSLLHAQEEKGRPVPSTSPQPQATPPSTAPGGRTVPQPTARANLVSLNFNRAELVEVIHVLAQHLKLTYTIDPKVKGSVTIYSAEPLKKEDLLPVFHQVLRMNNAVAIKTGDLYRIVPIKEGKGLARPVTGGKDDSYAIQVVPVRFFPVGEMKKLLTPFITPGGEILDYPRGNFLIIMDLPSNIRRLMEIRDLIDVNVFSGMRMEIYQPQIASAEDLAAEMSKIMQAYASSTAQAEGFAAQFLPIPRINQLLVISHSEAAWTYVKRWLERIDVVAEGPGRRIFIYPVENGKATELADILNEVLGQAPGARREPSSTLRDLHRAAPSIVPSLGGMQRGRGESQTRGVFAVTPAPAQPPRRRAAPSTGPARTRPSPGPQVKAPEPTRIVSDPATNSLIIFGTAQEFQNIKNILKDLDVIPRQVLLDVLVAEVTLTDDTKFGIEYEILRKGDTFTGAFAPSPVMISGGINALIGTGGAVRALIETLMSNSRVKVLASPHILATDNRPARIQVGSEEPVPTGVIEAATGAPTVSSSTTIQFRNTGKILTIIPQVNSKGLVHLQIKVEVSERGANVQVGNQSFPSFSTRDVETTAIVQDGETLVIGGIIDESKSRSRSGIPFLMDVPVLGWFFGVTTDSVKRTELIILITPHVIRSVDEARAVTEEFKERLSKVKREIERMKRKGKIQKSIAPKPTSPGPETKFRKAPKEEMTFNNTWDSATVPARAFTEESLDEIKPARSKIELPVRETDAVVKMAAALTIKGNGGTEKASLLPLKPERETLLRKTPETGGVKTGMETREAVWAVQVSAFARKRNAHTLTNRLKNKGHDAYTVRADIKGRTWYRVRVGRLATGEQAKELQERLKRTEKLAQAFTVGR